LNPVLIAVAAPVVTVTVSILLFRLWLRRLANHLEEVLRRSGEALLVGPEIAFYQGMIRRIISTETYGVIALTDRRLVFRKPIGRDIDIPLSQIAGISENKWFAGNYRGGHKFLILKLADGSEKAFQVKRHEGWMHALGSRVSAA
jgi:hypothetical protein